MTKISQSTLERSKSRYPSSPDRSPYDLHLQCNRSTVAVNLKMVFRNGRKCGTGTSGGRRARARQCVGGGVDSWRNPDCGGANGGITAEFPTLLA